MQVIFHIFLAIFRRTTYNDFMDFWKLQGTGNDFILVDNRENTIPSMADLAKAVCHRQFGVGADGLMAVEHSQTADVRMVYYNSDGSPAAMCGNGIRCFAKYVKDRGIVEAQAFSVETGDGIKQVGILEESEIRTVVQVDMGSSHGIRTIEVGSAELIFMQMGVPHSVYFTPDGAQLVTQLGPVIEASPVFPEGTNVNFVTLHAKDPLDESLNQSILEVHTWERGAGRTLACGTGACAAAIAAVETGLYKGQPDLSGSVLVPVQMAGGRVSVTLTKDTVYLTGPAELICKGTFYPSF